MRTLEQGKTIEELENAVNKLAKSKHKTSAELHDLRNELEMTETQAREKKAQSSQTMQQLKSELQTTKQALDESRVREKQVRRNLKVLGCRHLQVHPRLASFQITTFSAVGGGRVLFCARHWLHIFRALKTTLHVFPHSDELHVLLHAVNGGSHVYREAYNHFFVHVPRPPLFISRLHVTVNHFTSFPVLLVSNNAGFF